VSHLSYLRGLSVTVRRASQGDRHFIVMVIVIERMAYLSTFLPSMTVMTLMTVICEGFLDGVVSVLRRLFTRLFSIITIPTSI
jgi:hypothetical protein